MRLPTKPQIVKILEEHPLIQLRETVTAGYVVGSFATDTENDESDIDILLVVEPTEDTAQERTEHYRRALQQHFVTHGIKGKSDSIHPQWNGRRVDLYLSHGNDLDDRPRVRLQESR